MPGTTDGTVSSAPGNGTSIRGPELVVRDPDGRERVCPVLADRASVSIGRSRRNDLVLYDRYVSGRHLCLLIRMEGMYMQYLESKHGTFVNGERVNASVVPRLHDRDEIALGQSLIRVVAYGERLKRAFGRIESAALGDATRADFAWEASVDPFEAMGPAAFRGSRRAGRQMFGTARRWAGVLGNRVTCVRPFQNGDSGWLLAIICFAAGFATLLRLLVRG